MHSAGIIGESISSISIGIVGSSQVQLPPHPHHHGLQPGEQTWKLQVEVLTELLFTTDHVHCLQGQSQGILFANENLDTSMPLQW